MKPWLMLSTVFAMIAFLATSSALAQSKPADCKNRAPAQVAGQVVSVDQNSGKLTIREKNGTTHEFQANRETLQDMKPGDQIEAKLRQAPKC